MTAQTPHTVVVTHTGRLKKTTSRPPTNQLLLFLSHRRAGFIYTTGLNDFLNKSFERTCLCFHSSLHCYITVTQISRGRFSCTFLTWQLSDCLRIIWCGTHVGQTGRGLLNQIQRERERVFGFVQCWARGALVKVYQAVVRWHYEGHRKEETSALYWDTEQTKLSIIWQRWSTPNELQHHLLPRVLLFDFDSQK